jgi:hypothetical protein
MLPIRKGYEATSTPAATAKQILIPGVEVWGLVTLVATIRFKASWLLVSF